MKNGPTQRILAVLADYAAYAGRRPLWPLLGCLLVAGLSLFAAARLLSLNPKFDALLPDDTPAVKARLEAARRLGSTSLYLIAATSPDNTATLCASAMPPWAVACVRSANS